MLYTSTLFRLASHHCQENCRAWFILSARHGLVDPDAMLEPYEQSLASMSRKEREGWGTRVAKISAAVAAGQFAAVVEGPTYCPYTEAINGTAKCLIGAFGSRQEADAAINAIDDRDLDARYYVLPRPVVAPVWRSDFDDIPF